MFHEVVFHFRWRPLSHALLGAVTWLMARLVAGSAARAFGSISSWEERVRGICPRATPVEWLPVPSNIPAGEGIEAVRSASGTVIGHFGTYNPLITPPLERALVSLLQNRELSAVLLGRGGEDFRDRLVKQHPAFGGRVVAFGGLEATELAARLKGCDVLIQPYADGISCRRGSAMAGLASGVPVVSNLGALSENLWTTFGPIGLAGTPDAGELAVAAERVLALPAAERAAMGRHAAKLYRDRFGIENTIARLRSAGGGAST
jgi:glycosyltransferase involved in cell wall biosynthesis